MKRRTFTKKKRFPLKRLKSKADYLLSDIIDLQLSYTKFKYGNIIYSIGDNLLIKDIDNANIMHIVKVIKIIPINGMSQSPEWPCIQVQKYYTKNDIPSVSINTDILGDDELLLSDQLDKIYIETVIDKVRVYSLEDYLRLENIEELTFFTRAKYSSFTQEILPPIDEWEKYCYCNKPFNPDLLYICCDKCSKWFHSSCYGLTKDSAELLSKFYCNQCL